MFTKDGNSKKRNTSTKSK